MNTLVEFLNRVSMDNIAKYLVKFDYDHLGTTNMDGMPNGGSRLHTFKSKKGGIPILLPEVTTENRGNVAAWLLFTLSPVIGRTPDDVLAGFIEATTIFAHVTVNEPKPPQPQSEPQHQDDTAGETIEPNESSDPSATDPFSSP